MFLTYIVGFLFISEVAEASDLNKILESNSYQIWYQSSAEWINPLSWIPKGILRVWTLLHDFSNPGYVGASTSASSASSPICSVRSTKSCTGTSNLQVTNVPWGFDKTDIKSAAESPCINVHVLTTIESTYIKRWSLVHWVHL